jgi:hypothetical protein
VSILTRRGPHGKKVTRLTLPVLTIRPKIRPFTSFSVTLFSFSLSAWLFQYHEEHQYPIRGHGRSCRAGPLSCARSFTYSPHHFDSGDYKFRPLMVFHPENALACCTFPVLRLFDINDDTQERNPRVYRESPVCVRAVRPSKHSQQVSSLMRGQVYRGIETILL